MRNDGMIWNKKIDISHCEKKTKQNKQSQQWRILVVVFSIQITDINRIELIYRNTNREDKQEEKNQISVSEEFK